MNYSQLSLDSWIQTTIPYDSSYHIKDVLNEMIRLIQQVVDSTGELQFDYEINTFKQKWYTFIYKRLSQSNDEFEPYDARKLYQYFGSKFSDELQALFTRFTNITHRYNVGSLIPMDSVKATSVDIEENFYLMYCYSEIRMLILI